MRSSKEAPEYTESQDDRDFRQLDRNYEEEWFDEEKAMEDYYERTNHNKGEDDERRNSDV